MTKQIKKLKKDVEKRIFEKKPIAAWELILLNMRLPLGYHIHVLDQMCRYAQVRYN